MPFGIRTALAGSSKAEAMQPFCQGTMTLNTWHDALVFVQVRASESDTERLSLSVAPKLEANLSLLNACLDDVFLEQQTVSQYARALAWQQQQQAQWLQVSLSISPACLWLL